MDYGDDLEVRPPRPRRELRLGFSTGTAAAAAAQGALWVLLGRPCPEVVEVALPNGGRLAVPLAHHALAGDKGEAVVIKDAGDDPDVTHGAEIGVRVWHLPQDNHKPNLKFYGGTGVGLVTKPGLPVAVGEPAINPVPRRMVQRSLDHVWRQVHPDKPLSLAVEIFVPRGQELARQTLNPRLGILGGLSILGTTGLVKPYSHQAYRETIALSLKMARALMISEVVFTTGGTSEIALQRLRPELPKEAFVLMADYVAFALKLAGKMGFKEITVGAFFGKSLKMALGFGQTHASQGLADLAELGRWTWQRTGNKLLVEQVSRANTAREALELLLEAQAHQVLAEVGSRQLLHLRHLAGPHPRLTAVILNFDGQPLWQRTIC